MLARLFGSLSYGEAMSNCQIDHVSDLPDDVIASIEKIAYSQKYDNARHRCPMCAFLLGAKLMLEAAKRNDHANFARRLGLL